MFDATVASVRDTGCEEYNPRKNTTVTPRSAHCLPSETRALSDDYESLRETCFLFQPFETDPLSRGTAHSVTYICTLVYSMPTGEPRDDKETTSTRQKIDKKVSRRIIMARSVLSARLTVEDVCRLFRSPVVSSRTRKLER